MIRNIERIRYCGVFGNYSKPVTIEDFSEINLIYGWNYCGKTTLSRIFSCLEKKEIPSSLGPVEFALSRANEDRITHEGLDQLNLEVRVFNSDFIEENLRWNGEDFNPILLLGDDSIDAVNTITSKSSLLSRCRQGYSERAKRIDQIEKDREEQTKNTAKQIRQTLGTTDAFNASHLKKLLPECESDCASLILESNHKDELLLLALTGAADKKKVLGKIILQASLNNETTATSKLLSSNPEAKSAIRYLTENGVVAKWVQEGLLLHKNKTVCEYCQNDVQESRVLELNAHFSEDLKIFQNRLASQKQDLRRRIIEFVPYHESDLSKDLAQRFMSIQGDILSKIEVTNKQKNRLVENLDQKANDPFNSIEIEIYDDTNQKCIEGLVKQANQLLETHNTKIQNFESDKRQAIEKLKLHYVGEYAIELFQSNQEKIKKIYVSQKSRFQLIGNTLKQQISALEQTINKAQKGSKELNGYISKFLSDSNLLIEVVDIAGNDRFRLTRNGEVARNLSEGEKTAIAFSFFLCSLRQSSELEKMIVYIDDPISSLDSNHIFQINAVIKDYFYFKDTTNKWTLKVAQLFISTHNFEFLGLVKELPIQKEHRCKHYYINRVKPGESSFGDMPISIRKYTSEYQFLWSFIYNYSVAGDKTDISALMSLPNAVRRFIELYTYSKIPSTTKTSVEERASILFGDEKSKRILKVLHYFSYANDINKISRNSDLICDIDNVVTDVISLVREDTLHYNALMESI